MTGSGRRRRGAPGAGDLAVATIVADSGASPQISTRRETVRGPICSSSSCVVEVGGDQHRALRLVALVDQRVELLEHPVGAFLGAEVVDVEQVDRGQPLEEGEVGVAARLGVVGAADPRQQLRQRVDRDRVAWPPAPPWRPASPASSCRCRCRPSARGRGPRRGCASRSSIQAALGRPRPSVCGPSHVADRRAVEGDAAVARRDHRGDAAVAAAAQALRAALAGAGHVLGAEDPAGAVADAERAGPWPRNGSLRAIAGIRSQAPRRPATAASSPAARSALPGRSSRRIWGSGRGRPASWSRSGRSCAWR